MNESLNSFLFSTPQMARIFSPQAQLRAMMLASVHKPNPQSNLRGAGPVYANPRAPRTRT